MKIARENEQVPSRWQRVKLVSDLGVTSDTEPLQPGLGVIGQFRGEGGCGVFRDLETKNVLRKIKVADCSKSSRTSFGIALDPPVVEKMVGQVPSSIPFIGRSDPRV